MVGWCLMKVFVEGKYSAPPGLTSSHYKPLTPCRPQSVGGICFDFISLPAVHSPVVMEKWKSNFLFFCWSRIAASNTLSTGVMTVIFRLSGWELRPIISSLAHWPPDLLEEGVSPLEPGVVGVAGQPVVQGALSGWQEVDGTLGEDLDS